MVYTAAMVCASRQIRRHVSWQVTSCDLSDDGTDDFITSVYLNDSTIGLVYAYDFDVESGNITNKRIFIDRTGDNYGEPDGMVTE